MFAHMPEIMLCKPSNHDRWDRRVLQLAVFLYRHGHCNVPEVSLFVCAPARGMTAWGPPTAQCLAWRSRPGRKQALQVIVLCILHEEPVLQ